MCTIVREGESVSVSGERERITEQRREQQSRAEHAAERGAEQQSREQSRATHSPAAEQSRAAAMASRKHERSESR